MNLDEKAQDAQFVLLMQKELGGEISKQLQQQADQRRKDYHNGFERISWDEFAGNYS